VVEEEEYIPEFCYKLKNLKNNLLLQSQKINFAAMLDKKYKKL